MANFQDITAIAMVALAMVYLAQRAWRTCNGRSAGCAHGCSSCALAQAAPSNLVQLQPLATEALRDSVGQ